MLNSDDTVLVRELRRLIADLERQNRELRATVDALLHPPSSELLSKNMAHPSRK